MFIQKNSKHTNQHAHCHSKKWLRRNARTQKLIVLGFRGQKQHYHGESSSLQHQDMSITSSIVLLQMPKHLQISKLQVKKHNDMEKRERERERRKWNFQLWQGSRGSKNGHSIPKNTPNNFLFPIIIKCP